MAEKPPIALVILDGFGYQESRDSNAIALAKTPHFDQWLAQYPHTLLQASGAAVGLPKGYIGNSEVGHMTIGAGRVIKQPVTRINEAIADGTFFTNPTLTHCLQEIKAGSNRLHIMGLLSDAGVHCLSAHIIAYIKAAHLHGIKHIFIHPFLDGRDAPPQSAHHYLSLLDAALQEIGAGIIGSVHGRFYAMDRNKNWERTEISYRLLTTPTQPHYENWQSCIESAYNQGITDEFILPALLSNHAVMQSGDAIICANFRPDRSRQITAAFITPDFQPFETSIHPLWYFTPVSYAANLPTKTLLPHRAPLSDTLTDVLHAHHKRLFAIAETEKYAHVTYFFNGGREKPYTTETQMLIPSLVLRNYVEHPAMSADAITNEVLASLSNNPCDVYLINYANADMVGHSGNLSATIRAIEVLDYEMGRLYDQLVLKMGGTIYLTADHGNAEQMIDPITKQPKTAHTLNPVPFIVLAKNAPKSIALKSLADIAPYILSQLHLPIPEAMTRT